jgi:hypothetical protein
MNCGQNFCRRKLKMKKSIITIIVCVYLYAAAAGVSAAENETEKASWLSVGAGFSVMGAIDNGATGSYKFDVFEAECDLSSSLLAFSGFAFASVKYAELRLGISGSRMDISNGTTYEGKDENGLHRPGIFIRGDVRIQSFDIGLLGKLPIRNPSNPGYFMPLLGLEYQAVYSAVDDKTGEKSDSPGDFSMLWFQAGLGYEFDISEHFFITIQALYGIRLPTKYENDWKESVESQEAGSAESKINQRFKSNLMAGWKL